MSIIHNAALAAIAVACLSSVAQAADREPVRARIETADLNLASHAGQATLRRRVSGAAERLCRAEGRRIDELADAARCRREMLSDGEAKMAALQGRDDVQLAARR